VRERARSARRAALSALAGVWLAATAAAGGTPRIEVQALFRDRAVLLVDGVRRVLVAGETSPEGITLLDADSRRARIEIGGEARTLALGTRIGASFDGPREQQVRVVADAAGMYLASGSINGVPVRFLLDTGATLVSINERLAERLNLDHRRRGTPGESVTAAGVVPVWRLRLARVSVGEVQLTDVEAAVHQGDFPPVALLGNSFLSRLEMERSGREVVLRRRF